MYKIGKFCTLRFPLKSPLYAEELVPKMLQNVCLKDFNNVEFSSLKTNFPKVLLNFDSVHVNMNSLKPTVQRKQGDKVEDSFLNLCKIQNLKVRRATLYEDYYLHYDVAIEIEGEEILIDIKGLKSLRRNGPLQNEHIFVEIHEEGWLKSGKADYIAFEFNENVFLIYSKKFLNTYVDSLITEKTDFVQWPEQSKEKVYVRTNERVSCALTLINTLDSFKVAGVGKLMS